MPVSIAQNADLLKGCIPSA